MVRTTAWPAAREHRLAHPPAGEGGGHRRLDRRGRRDQSPQLETLARLCREGDVDVAVIGSEVLLREGPPVEDLMDARGGAPDDPEGDPRSRPPTRRSFLDHPELLPLIDLVYVNYYPYWDGVSIDEAIPTLAAWHDSMREYAQGKPVVVSEAGWPSDGDAVGGDRELRRTRRASSWSSSLGEAERRPLHLLTSRRALEGEVRGAAGSHWGYRDRDGVLKPGMQAVFDGIATDIGEPQIEFTSVPPRGSEANLVEVSGIGTHPPRRRAPRGRRALVHQALLSSAHGSHQLHRPVRGRRRRASAIERRPVTRPSFRRGLRPGTGGQREEDPGGVLCGAIASAEVAR